MIPYATAEWWESACFALSWMPHGGSGLGRSYLDCLEMTLPHILRDLKRIEKQRARESDAMRQAYSRKR